MMNEEPRDMSLFIGLHKLAEHNGDGLVPELYALMSARAEAGRDMTNVVTFPANISSQKSVTPPDQTGRLLAFRR